MIKRKDYKKAKKIIKQYKQEQLNTPITNDELTIQQIESIKFRVIGSGNGRDAYKLKHAGNLCQVNNITGMMCIGQEYYEFIHTY
jgi:hypothetical protein